MDVTSYLLGKKAGGGSGGTTNYNELSNKPSINDVELSGNKTSSDLGLQSTVSSTNMIESDYVSDYMNTHKFVTLGEKTRWNDKQDALQFSAMPTASSDNVGKIVQYIGTTTSTSPIYTNGYFYKCIESGGNYSWENIQVQEITGGTSPTKMYIINYDSLSGDEAKPILKQLAQDYINDNNYQFIILQKYYLGAYGSDVVNIYYLRKIFHSGNSYSFYFSTNYNSDISGSFKYQMSYNSSTQVVSMTYQGDVEKQQFGSITTNDSNTTSTLWSPVDFRNSNIKFYYAPKYNGDKTLTNDLELTHKKYVDDKPTTYSGYDATKTQVLKNINGTLTWVDE